MPLTIFKYSSNAGDNDNHYLLALATLGGTTEIEMILMRLCQPPDGSTSPKYKLFHF
jgi:hypothetical protein